MRNGERTTKAGKKRKKYVPGTAHKSSHPSRPSLGPTQRTFALDVAPGGKTNTVLRATDSRRAAEHLSLDNTPYPTKEQFRFRIQVQLYKTSTFDMYMCMCVCSLDMYRSDRVRLSSNIQEESRELASPNTNTRQAQVWAGEGAEGIGEEKAQ